MKNIKLKFLILLCLTVLVKLEGEKSKANEKSESKDKQVIYRNENLVDDYVLPHIRKEPEYILQHRTVTPVLQPVAHNAEIHVGQIAPVAQVTQVAAVQPLPIEVPLSQSCPCAAQVQCKPCGVVASPMNENYQFLTGADCPCAPRLNCPMCPPLSLLHEIASKKVYINF
jgi:hypothetical protein